VNASAPAGPSAVIPLRPLRRWAARGGRTFPWRASRGYELAVAEVLLQKTRGEAVVPVWQTLIKHFPTAQALAEGNRCAIRDIVAPLGLKDQRSDRLIAMCSAWPVSAADGCLPGLGSYGAGVVLLAEGFNAPTPPVDGNVARVVSRFLGWTFDTGEARKKPQVREVVGQTLSRARGSKLSLLLALVDLGALICLPRNPSCGDCPLSPECASSSVGATFSG
jgi:A/G-specific adenine glycosylase